MTVAGDAMHVMGLFIGQGGSAAMEDTVVLAPCLARKMQANINMYHDMKGVEEGIDEYVKESIISLLKILEFSELISLILGSKSNAVDTSVVATVLPVSEVVVQQEYVHTVSSVGGNVVTSDAGDPPSSVSVLPVDVKSNVVNDRVYVGSDSKENVVSSSVGCGKDSVYGAFSASGADLVSFSFDPSFVEESQVCESAALSAVGM
ncbi:hypothetical protein ACOSQ4_003784 [Xanthoceras sorbifolium]